MKLKIRVMPVYAASASASLSRSRRGGRERKVFEMKEKVEMMDHLSYVLYLKDL